MFTMGGGDWICSGTSVSDGGRAGYSIVLTAGHCAIDETNGAFATELDVHPGLRHGADVHLLGVDLRLLDGRRAGRPQPVRDGGLVQRPGGHERLGARDRRTGRQVRVRRSSIPSSGPIRSPSRVSSTGNKLYAFGYPAAGKYHGKDLVYCAGDIIQDSGTANQTWGMACNMTGGSSGGPWLSGFIESTGTGTLSSVNSYGYGDQAVMYGPKFNSRTQATYNAARTATSNVKVTGG